MSLNDFSTITISIDAAGLKQKGFGVILCAAYHDLWPELTKEVTELSELTALAVPTKHPVYRMCQAAFAQDPRPEKVKVGKLTSAYTQTVRLTPVAVHSAEYVITIETLTGTKAEASYTADSATTVAEITAGLTAAIDALGFSEIDATDDTTHVTVASDSGQIAYYSDWDPAKIKFEDRTTDPGVATNLDAIKLYDADWYGLAVDLNARTITEEAADWAEAQQVIFATQTSDWQAPESGETVDIGDVLQAKSYKRSYVLFKQDDTSEYSGLASLAEAFPFDVGTAGGEAGGTFNAKTLAGMTADKLQPSHKTNLANKNYTVYIETAGVSHTLGGKMAGGEWIDVTRGIDWYAVRTSERLAALQLGNRRVAFTDAGIARVLAQVEAQNKEAIAAGLFSDDPAPAITVPTAASVSALNKSARVLPNVKMKATLQGAIHTVQLTANISP